MPLIDLQTNVALPDSTQNELLAALSRLVAEGIGKPERYVMATLGPRSALMAGQPGPAAFVEVRSIGGLTPQVNQRLAAAICQLLEEKLKIPSDRVYLNFAEVAATDWGWNREIFG